MTSVVYRERDREYDSRTNVSSSRRDRDGGYTTVKRYVIKDDDTRSSYGGRDSRSFVPERAGERVEETRIIRRENEVEEAPRREPRREDTRYSTEELVIRRDREDDRRDPYYDRRPPPERSSDQELIIRRTTESEEPRRDDLAMSRFDDRRDQRYGDGYEVLSPRRGDFVDRDRDIQRYSRTTDYYTPAPQPQIVVLKQDPIIIRERIRDDDYQVVRKTDVEEEKSVVRRQPEPPKEEEYFYEKKVRERIDDGRRRSRSRDDDWRERRVMKREVSPHDSVSQVGGRRDYSSDDSMVYVKRTKETETNGSPSPDRRKNLAAGAIAGLGAAELLRNHKKKEGRETSHGIGRIGRDVGAAGLGAVAAEGISRARSAYRSRSRRRRSRSRSDSRDSGRSRKRSRSRRRSRSGSRSRSRSQSRSKLKTLGAYGLGAAALAAAAAVAAKKMSKNKEEPQPEHRGRSSSRHRSDRVETMQELTNDPAADDARNPKHRNKRMAEAGAAGAAITALIDRARSKSRGRDRSRSRIRQAAPIVAAGLGSAALAGLYERNKAKNEAEVIQKDERRSARSRSRSRARTEYTDGTYRDGALNDPGLIEYGDGPMHGNNYGEGYYGRPAPQEGYYANQTAVVPAPGTAAPAPYGASREIREPSPSYGRERRSRSRSTSSSPGGRHRSGRRRAAEAVGAAGAGAAAASVYERTKQEKRERKARKRREQEQYSDPYDEGFNPQGAYAPPSDAYATHTQTGYYPEGGNFPPPPGAGPYMPDPAATQQGGYPGQGYPPPPPGGQIPPPPGAPGYEPYASGANPYAQPRGPDNVSVPNSSVPDGLNTSRSVDPVPPPPPGPPPFASPSINVQPPSAQPDPTQLHTPPSYVPPIMTPRGTSPPRDRNLNASPEPAARPRANSQPPPSSAASGPRKSVQFAAQDDVQPVDTPASEASMPEGERARRRRRDRGYEAGDDTDSTADDQRRRNRELDPSTAEREPDRDDDGKRHHRRRRSHDPSTASSRRERDRDGDRDRDRDRDRAGGSSRSKDKGKQRQTDDGGDSDATEELPPRFDNEGHKKSERGEDPIADRLEEIISGKGAAGKVFGNFVDGLFGPERKKRDH